MSKGADKATLNDETRRRNRIAQQKFRAKKREKGIQLNQRVGSLDQELGELKLRFRQLQNAVAENDIALAQQLAGARPGSPMTPSSTPSTVTSSTILTNKNLPSPLHGHDDCVVHEPQNIAGEATVAGEGWLPNSSGLQNWPFVWPWDALKAASTETTSWLPQGSGSYLDFLPTLQLPWTDTPQTKPPYEYNGGCVPPPVALF